MIDQRQRLDSRVGTNAGKGQYGMGLEIPQDTPAQPFVPLQKQYGMDNRPVSMPSIPQAPERMYGKSGTFGQQQRQGRQGFGNSMQQFPTSSPFAMNQGQNLAYFLQNLLGQPNQGAYGYGNYFVPQFSQNMGGYGGYPYGGNQNYFQQGGSNPYLNSLLRILLDPAAQYRPF